MVCEVSFFGRVAKLRRGTISFVTPASLFVRPSVRMEQLGSQWADFYEICYLSVFRKSVEKFQASLQSDRNNEYFKRRPTYIYEYISLHSSQNETYLWRINFAQSYASSM